MILGRRSRAAASGEMVIPLDPESTNTRNESMAVVVECCFVCAAKEQLVVQELVQRGT